MVSPDVDGDAEEGTSFVPAHGMRRIGFTPRPSGLRFYHTHNRAGADLRAGQYSGQVGPVYIEPKHELGNYDREVFLVLKEFSPAGLRFPLVSLADLPTVTPVARSAAPASPTSVQTAFAAVWRSATSDARSRFRARAVARTAPGPALSTLPRAAGSDREAL